MQPAEGSADLTNQTEDRKLSLFLSHWSLYTQLDQHHFKQQCAQSRISVSNKGLKFVVLSLYSAKGRNVDNSIWNDKVTRRRRRREDQTDEETEARMREGSVDRKERGETKDRGRESEGWWFPSRPPLWLDLSLLMTLSAGSHRQMVN